MIGTRHGLAARRAEVAACRAAVVYFAIVFAAGFVLGALRMTVLVPRLGELAAVALEIPVMLAISWCVCRWLVRRLGVPATWTARLVMGGLAFALLMVVEAGLAVVLGQSLRLFVAALVTPPGLLGLAGQFGFGLMPLAESFFGPASGSR